MQTKELIILLQKLVSEHEPFKEMMGEHEVSIDVWKQVQPHLWQYAGVSPNMQVEVSADGVYHIITAKETWE